MTKIIAFEGIDGTGKSVQMQGLAQRLARSNLAVESISFPMYDTFFGTEVGILLTGREGVRADTVDGKSMALWFALDRFEAFRNLDFSKADVLLINRYVLSNAVYQSIRDVDLGKPDLLEFVMALEYGHLGLPRADVHLVLDVNPVEASRNVEKKGYREYTGNQKDVYEALPALQQRAREKYIDYSLRLPNVRLVPCMGANGLKSIDEIGSLIDETLSDILQQASI